MRTYLQKHSKIKYSDHWSTPEDIYDKYVKNNNYYDPCPLHGSEFNFDIVNNEVFLNPPYSEIEKWIEWALYSHRSSKKHMVILIPSRTDTKYFHKLLNYGCELEFVKGRLKFGGVNTPAPFPSVLVHLREVYI